MPTRRPIAAGYARASHDDNQESLPAQVKRIEDFYNFQLKEICDWDRVHYDNKPVSASKIPFSRRPAGKELIELLQPGDHIIFDKVDRIWRSVTDFVKLMEWFKNHEIVVHIVDFRGCTIAMGTPMGDFMLTLMVAIAELESKTTSHRIKESFRHMLDNHEWPFRNNIYGTKVVIENGKRCLRFDPDERRIMALVVALHDERGCSFEHIARVVGIKSSATVIDLYLNERLIRDLKITDPINIPRGQQRQELVNRYKEQYEVQRLRKLRVKELKQQGFTIAKAQEMTKAGPGNS
jgi:DNA invertase Pin-like site-specific DNA recombinase